MQTAEYEWKTSHRLSSRAMTPFENNSAHVGESGVVLDTVAESFLMEFASLSFEVARRADIGIRMQDVTSPK